MIVDRINIKDDYLNLLQSNIDNYTYDQYFLYPSKTNEGWKNFLTKRILEYCNKDNVFVFYESYLGFPFFLILETSDWDDSHFGIKMGKISLIIPNLKIDYSDFFNKMLLSLNNFLILNKIKFVSARINGDNLFAIKCFEDYGFHYIENVIWPVLNCDLITDNDFNNVRRMKDNELDVVINIANNYQYQRGHFHCDDRFDKKLADNMYGKWVESAYCRGDIINIIEFQGKPSGYFICCIDNNLSEMMGFKYGRLKSMAIDSSIRGKKLGKILFNGTLKTLKKLGAEYIDSGYSTKNHLSARIHAIAKFYSVYEEITLHKWINY